MKALTAALLALPFSLALQAQSTASPVGAQTPASAPAAAASSLNGEGTGSRAHVTRLQPPPRIVRPPQTQLVSTAQSGASRSAKALTSLPQFKVIDRSDKSVTIGSVSHTGRWILLYRGTDCMPCDRVMNTLSASNSGSLSQGLLLTVIVGSEHPHLPHAAVSAAPGTANAAMTAAKVAPARAAAATAKTSAEEHDELDRTRTKFSGLTQASWVYDRRGEAFLALHPKGAPTLYGMDGDRVVWSAAGAMTDPMRLERQVAGWLSKDSLSLAGAALASKAGTASRISATITAGTTSAATGAASTTNAATTPTASAGK